MRKLDKAIRDDLARLDRAGCRRLRDRDRCRGTGRFAQRPQGASGPVTTRHLVGDDAVHEGRFLDCPTCHPPS